MGGRGRRIVIVAGQSDLYRETPLQRKKETKSIRKDNSAIVKRYNANITLII